MDGLSIENTADSVSLSNLILAKNAWGGTSENPARDLFVDDTTGFVSNYNVVWNPDTSTANGRTLIKYKGCSATNWLALYQQCSRRDTNSTQADPQFTDPAAGVFTLLCGSPAIDAADTIIAGWPTTDAAGAARVDHGAFANNGRLGGWGDRGAFEAPDSKPGSVTNMSVECGSTGVAIHWTFSGEDYACGTADSFAVIVDTDQGNAANFVGEPWLVSDEPYVSGTEYCVERTGLARGTTYYFAIRTRDEGGQVSDVSVVSGTTASSGWYDVLCDGSFAYHPPLEEESGAVGMAAELPTEMELALGPNPLKRWGTIGFGIPAWGHGKAVELAIFDVAGRRIATIEQGTATAGRFQRSSATSMRDPVKAGVYFVRFVLDGRRLSRTVVLAP